MMPNHARSAYDGSQEGRGVSARLFSLRVFARRAAESRASAPQVGFVALRQNKPAQSGGSAPRPRRSARRDCSQREQFHLPVCPSLSIAPSAVFAFDDLNAEA